MTDWLSQYNVDRSYVDSPISDNNILNQINSPVTCAIALYSASALDWETTCYFVLFQETKLPLRNMEYPDVDLLSVRHPAQPASENPVVFKWP